MILGVVLAGGQSRRFGSDKALAQLNGQSLLERAVHSLAALCDAVCVAGRKDVPSPALAVNDWPKASMGPLGGLAGALRYAHSHGFASVLSTSVDSYNLPETLLDTLGQAPSYIHAQPVIGHWPIHARVALEDILMGAGRHSMLAFAHAIDARPCQSRRDIGNINTPQDLCDAQRICQDGICQNGI